MPLPIPLLAALVGAGTSALGGGISAFGQARNQQQARDVARTHRARLNQLMGRIQDTNYADVNQAASGGVGRNDRAIQAQAAARGISGGSVGASRDRVLGQALAQLAQFKQQDQLQRQQAVGQLLQDPAFDVPSQDVNIFGDTLLGFLGGAAAGAGQGAGAILGNEEILKMLADSEGSQVDASNFGLADVVGGGGRPGTGQGPLLSQQGGGQPSAVGWQGGMPGASQLQAPPASPSPVGRQGAQGGRSFVQPALMAALRARNARIQAG